MKRATGRIRRVSWAQDNTLRLWDLETGTAQTFEGHNGSVYGALLLPDGRRALSWSKDNTLRLWISRPSLN